MKQDPVIKDDLQVSELWIGKPLPRMEDRRFLSGHGRYVDNMILPGQLYAQFLRSPHPHARITSIRKEDALASPGVVACLTAEDLGEIHEIAPQWALPGTLVHGRPVLARDVVRHVGEPVAMIIAETEAAAADAVEKIDVRYETLPHVLCQDEALKPDAVALHPDVPGNLATTFARNKDTFEDAAAEAEVQLSFALRNQRLVPFPIECRAVNAQFDPLDGTLTVHVGQQLPHMFRRMLSEMLALGEQKIRVISPDVGGGFGAKMHFYPEDVAVSFAARQLGRPVKWAERRRENASTTSNGRDHKTTVEIAADRDGRIRALRVNSRANVGAYLSSMGGGVPTINVGLFVLGVYDIPVAEVAIHCVYTNTTPVDAYRGAGRPEAAYIIERTIDRLARELGLDPVAVRRRNFLKTENLPHRNVAGATLDSGRYDHTLSRACELADYDAFHATHPATGGRVFGIGVSNYTETCGVGPSELQAVVGFDRGGYESARVILQSDGKALVFSGAHSHGQGHVTTFAQIAADALSIPPEDIEVIQGDTNAVPQGVGTFNSRSVAVGGSAVKVAADRVAERVHKLAAHLLKVPPEAVERSSGWFVAEGGVRKVSFAQTCREAWTGHRVPRDFGIGLEETEFYHPRAMSAPYGAHISMVGIDVETGELEVLDYVAVDDCGTVINPLLARGQIHGGIVQGIGQALFEDGTPAGDGTLPVEQAIPRIDMVPHMLCEHTVTPSWTNPLGAKGIGEAGTIGAPPTIVNAALDALWHLGVRDLDMPLTPERVLAAIHHAEENQ